MIDHPRWGLIQSLVVTRDIKAGEELLHDYGYEYPPLEFPFDFPWYWELKRKTDKQKRLQRKIM